MGIKSQRELIIIALHVISSLTGLCEAFFAGVLIFIYHMDKISYLQDGAYGTFPLIIGSLGSIVTLTSFFGIIAALTKSRPGTVISAAIIGLCIIPQLYCIRLAGDITNHIETEMIHEQQPMTDHLRDAIQEGRKEDLNNFFQIQRDFGCCGVVGNKGYQDWDSFWSFQPLKDKVNFNNGPNPEPRGNNRSLRALKFEKEDSVFGPKDLPSSCCIGCSEACRCESQQFFNRDKETRMQYSLHRVGCINIIEMIYKRELTGILDDGFPFFILVTVSFQAFQVFFSYLNYRSMRKGIKVLECPSPTASNVSSDSTDSTESSSNTEELRREQKKAKKRKNTARKRKQKQDRKRIKRMDNSSSKSPTTKDSSSAEKTTQKDQHNTNDTADQELHKLMNDDTLPVENPLPYDHRIDMTNDDTKKVSEIPNYTEDISDTEITFEIEANKTLKADLDNTEEISDCSIDSGSIRTVKFIEGTEVTVPANTGAKVLNWIIKDRRPLAKPTPTGRIVNYGPRSAMPRVNIPNNRVTPNLPSSTQRQRTTLLPTPSPARSRVALLPTPTQLTNDEGHNVCRQRIAPPRNTYIPPTWQQDRHHMYQITPNPSTSRAPTQRDIVYHQDTAGNRNYHHAPCPPASIHHRLGMRVENNLPDYYYDEQNYDTE